MDELNIDTFYKAVAYACLYKVLPNHVDEIQAEEIDVYKRQLQGYLNSSQPLVAYYFPEGMYYYLNFKTEQDANDFFANYYNNNQDVYKRQSHRWSTT